MTLDAPLADAELRSWYASAPLDLAWLGRPQWRAFRWRDARGAWHEAARVRDAEALRARLLARPPADLYVTTAAWLDPARLPRLGDRERPPPILLDHLVVFDVDVPPFSVRSLERARREARRVVRWLARDTPLALAHVAFSGAKGFHVVARDPDRAPFEEPDRRKRESRVRDARATLLARALDAGLAVDRTVTADTRRVIRLPGSLHSGTGFACAIVPEERLSTRVDAWLPELPRHARAPWPPSRPPAPVARAGEGASAARARERARKRALELQATSHVAGTRDRSALLAWLPKAWGAGARARERALAILRESGLAPGLLFALDDRLLLLVPRAVPRAALAARLSRALPGFAGALDRRGHAWAAVAGRVGPGRTPAGALLPAGVLAADAPCAHPWSRPHVALAKRLGQDVEASGAIAGRGALPLRLAEIS